MTPYQEGATAASLGLTTDDNPYPPKTRNYVEWNNGFWAYKKHKYYG